ncbi:exported hypothetical protein [Pseudomonas jessenii]
MGASLLAMAACQAAGMLAVMASSRASSLPQGFRVNTRFVLNRNPLWERACSRWRRVRRQGYWL